jgi:uncharacterized protein YdeI (YjbR/CyaY-like superfamily)
MRLVEAVELPKTLYVTNRDEWRHWLEQNHATEKEIWLIYYKKSSGKPYILHDDAVEEALCFGWIDSLAKKIDDERRIQKFSPRRPTSNWSFINKQRVKRLMAEGKMTEAGLALVPEALLRGEEIVPPPVEIFEIPDDLRQALENKANAWENFQRFTPKYQQLCLRWINAAKKAETRERRIQEVAELTAQNKKIGLK